MFIGDEDTATTEKGTESENKSVFYVMKCMGSNSLFYLKYEPDAKEKVEPYYISLDELQQSN